MTLLRHAPRASGAGALACRRSRGLAALGAIALLAVLGAPASAAGARPPHARAGAGHPIAGDVALIGDSLGLGIEDRLRRLLGGMRLRADDRVGRPLADGLRVMRSLRHRPVVLAVSLFTNDDPAGVRRLRHAVHESTRYVADGGCVVWATISRPAVAGTGYGRANAALRALASGDPRVVVVDWAAYARGHPRRLAPDGVHATVAGYGARARLYARAIERCARRATRRPDASLTPPGRCPGACRARSSTGRRGAVRFAGASTVRRRPGRPSSR